MWEKEIIKIVNDKLSSTTFINQKVKDMYEFLFLNKKKDFDFFYFLIFSFKDSNENKGIMDLFLDIVKDSFYIEIDNYYILFYKEKLEIEIDRLLLSLSEDFSVNIRLFLSGKISFEKPDNFVEVFKAYKKVLDKDNYYYCSNKDLIMELYNKNKKILLKLKPIIINTILADHQLENLVYSFVSNDLNITKTAKDIYMHRNTINNKLDLIQKETQLNIRHFHDAMALLLLLSL